MLSLFRRAWSMSCARMGTVSTEHSPKATLRLLVACLDPELRLDCRALDGRVRGLWPFFSYYGRSPCLNGLPWCYILRRDFGQALKIRRNQLKNSYITFPCIKIRS